MAKLVTQGTYYNIRKLKKKKKKEKEKKKMSSPRQKKTQHLGNHQGLST
jgi:hypothetical protein